MKTPKPEKPISKMTRIKILTGLTVVALIIFALSVLDGSRTTTLLIGAAEQI